MIAQELRDQELRNIAASLRAALVSARTMIAGSKYAGACGLLEAHVVGAAARLEQLTVPPLGPGSTCTCAKPEPCSLRVLCLRCTGWLRRDGAAA